MKRNCYRSHCNKRAFIFRIKRWRINPRCAGRRSAPRFRPRAIAPWEPGTCSGTRASETSPTSNTGCGFRLVSKCVHTPPFFRPYNSLSGPLIVLWGLVSNIQSTNPALSVFLLAVGGLVSLWVMVGYSANAVVIFGNLDIDEGGVFLFSQVMMIILLVINGLVIVGVVWTITHVVKNSTWRIKNFFRFPRLDAVPSRKSFEKRKFRFDFLPLKGKITEKSFARSPYYTKIYTPKNQKGQMDFLETYLNYYYYRERSLTSFP